jgi:hypothetical protein
VLNKNSFEIISTLPVLLQNSQIRNLSLDQKKIEKVWLDENTKKSKKLFNDKILTYINSHIQNEKFVVESGYLDYKIILGTKIDSSIKIEIKPIGVSGIIIIKNNSKNYILFSKRSSDTTEYPNSLELVPSGHLDISVLQKNNKIDHVLKLKQEFCEETGLNSDSIDKITPLCFVQDVINHVYDVCSIIEISILKEDLFKSFKNVSEYDEPILIPFSTLENFVNENYDDIVPTSLGILQCFINKNMVEN